MYLAQEGDIEKSTSCTQVAYALTDICDIDPDYPVIGFDTQYLTTKKEATDEINVGQCWADFFSNVVHKFLNGATKPRVLNKYIRIW